MSHPVLSSRLALPALTFFLLISVPASAAEPWHLLGPDGGAVVADVFLLDRPYSCDDLLAGRQPKSTNFLSLSMANFDPQVTRPFEVGEYVIRANPIGAAGRNAGVEFVGKA